MEAGELVATEVAWMEVVVSRSHTLTPRAVMEINVVATARLTLPSRPLHTRRKTLSETAQASVDNSLIKDLHSTKLAKRIRAILLCMSAT